MGILSTLQDQIYDLAEHYGELKALERLFTERFLQDIEESEKQAIEGGSRCKVGVDLAWIDKIPLASLCSAQTDLAGHPIKGRIELGDLLVHRTNSVVTPKKIFVKDSRSAIVQAKLSNTTKPFVPVGRESRTRATSTSKELKLLQDWPSFDLFETSRSKTAILTNTNVNSSAANSFYWAFVQSEKKWLSGKAVNKNQCSETLEQFFSNLRNGTYGECVQSRSAWSDLTFATLKTARNRKIPPSLNAEIRSRVQSAIYHTSGFGGALWFRRPIAILMIDIYIDESSG